MGYGWCIILFLHYFFANYDCINSESAKTLKLVQILFRHGDRTPTETYPNDPYQYWPDGWGQLTKMGKMQMYNLGLKYRKIYKEFLREYYMPNEVKVKSSYADRCLMSAELVLAGLYPPIKEQIWNSDLLWQPIPVTHLPRKLDNIIALKMDCPVYDAEFLSAKHSERLQEINEKNKDLYAYLTEHTGKNITDIGAVETLYNTLEIEMTNNLSLPLWTKNISFSTLLELAKENLALYTDNVLMKRLKGGVLLNEIIAQMTRKTKDDHQSKGDLVLYSGHDLTIVTLMRTLGFDSLLKPEFGATLTFELHYINNNDQVQVLYSNNYTADPTQLQLQFCQFPCTLTAFVEGLKSVLPLDWDHECMQ